MRDDDTAAWEDDDREWFECLWCGVRIVERVDDPSPHYPYCSPQCGWEAELDSDEDDVASAW